MRTPTYALPLLLWLQSGEAKASCRPKSVTSDTYQNATSTFQPQSILTTLSTITSQSSAMTRTTIVSGGSTLTTANSQQTGSSDASAGMQSTAESSAGGSSSSSTASHTTSSDSTVSGLISTVPGTTSGTTLTLQSATSIITAPPVSLGSCPAPSSMPSLFPTASDCALQFCANYLASTVTVQEVEGPVSISYDFVTAAATTEFIYDAETAAASTVTDTYFDYESTTIEVTSIDTIYVTTVYEKREEQVNTCSSFEPQPTDSAVLSSLCSCLTSAETTTLTIESDAPATILPSTTTIYPTVNETYTYTVVPTTTQFVNGTAVLTLTSVVVETALATYVCQNPPAQVDLPVASSCGSQYQSYYFVVDDCDSEYNGQVIILGDDYGSPLTLSTTVKSAFTIDNNNNLFASYYEQAGEYLTQIVGGGDSGYTYYLNFFVDQQVPSSDDFYPISCSVDSNSNVHCHGYTLDVLAIYGGNPVLSYGPGLSISLTQVNFMAVPACNLQH